MNRGTEAIGWPPFGADEAGDCAFLRAARDAVGTCPLMVDAAQARDGPTATARPARVTPYGLTWVEEPLDRDDLTGRAARALGAAIHSFTFPAAPRHAGDQVVMSKTPVWGRRPDLAVLRHLCLTDGAAA